jgi:sucrose phosphorylase
VSYKHNPDGSQSPYELNVSYFDALSDPRSEEPLDRQVARFLAAHAIMLALAGLPAIYFHSLFGSRGWPEGVQQTGRSRTINRQKLDVAQLSAELAAPGHRRQVVYGRFVQLLRARAASAAFHPLGGQRVLDCGDHCVAVLRVSPAGDARALCLHDVSGAPQTVALDLATLGWDASQARNLLDERVLPADSDGRLSVFLPPYGVAWLEPAQ